MLMVDRTDLAVVLDAIADTDKREFAACSLGKLDDYRYSFRTAHSHDEPIVALVNCEQITNASRSETAHRVESIAADRWDFGDLTNDAPDRDRTSNSDAANPVSRSNNASQASGAGKESNDGGTERRKPRY